MPPAPLLSPCQDPEPRPLLLIRDIVHSRQDYITQFSLCKTQVDRLNEWYKTPLKNAQ